jgi:RNA polymerase sigma-70 factor, ECF subfamily
LIALEGEVEEPDPRVISAARAGDARAFESLVRRYQADVYRFVLHLIRDPQAAEDITQESFVRAFRFLRRYRGDSRFTTWLFSIARNCVVDETRRWGRRHRVADRVGRERDAFMSPDQTLAVEVREALATLPQELLEPVVLIDVFSLSYRETAEMLSVAEGTIKSRVHRAREQLIALLGPQGEERADDA